MKILSGEQRKVLHVLIMESAGIHSMSGLASIHNIHKTKEVADSLETLGFVSKETRVHYWNDRETHTSEIYCLTKKGAKYLHKWIMARFKEEDEGES